MTKVISLSEKAYTTLKSMKKNGESFSDVVLRVAEKKRKRSLLEFAGTWKGDDIDEVFAIVLKDREQAKSREFELQLTILDTTAMVAFLKGKLEATKKINELMENNDRIAITIFTVYELLKGAYLSARHEENVLDVTQAISGLEIFDLSPQACEEAARIYFDLKRTGTLIGEIDILIAAIAKTNGEAILTRDKHFKCIKGLELANW